MDIGPVRRRLTAEPLTSPVPGVQEWAHEPSARERVPTEQPSEQPSALPTQDADTATSA
jgi:hypothetical protein